MTIRSIFITGAASGIGLATARQFVASGWRVGLCDIDASGLEDLKTDLGDAASIHPADVADAQALSDALDAFCAGGEGPLDVIFNCAGILEMRMFADTSLSRLHAIVDVNVKGVLNGAYRALPHLRKSSDTRIITMNSLSAIHGIPEEAAYSASKAFVKGLTEALNIELEPEGIWVCDIMVAYVSTPMLTAATAVAKSVEILGVNVEPGQVAAVVLQAATERRVHWFVTAADEAVAKQIDETPWDDRRNLVKSITGF